jgi:NAD(P)-dependent dehydrogenase (short-subunit alcohol dehydrogenase family)
MATRMETGAATNPPAGKESAVALYRASPKDGAAWITGASAGIGQALARSLAREGYVVYASARGREALEALAAEDNGPGRIMALPLDVTDDAASRQAVERIVGEAGSLALAIFNAGTFVPVRAFRPDRSQYDQTMALNFTGVLNGLLPAIGAMQQAGRGQIAVVSSSASYGGLPKSAAYGASKAALNNMAASLKFDLDAMNIRIQIVTPGFVETPLTGKNDFPMPFLMPADKAAEAFAKGLRSGGFDITFPKRFTYMLKFVNLLPYWLYFPVVAAMTGAGRSRKG